MTTTQRPRDLGTERARRLVVEVGRDLRDGRRRCGLSQERVARAAGISHGHLSRVERGLVPTLSIDLARRLSTVVGLDLSVRTFPGGIRIRDIGQVRLLVRFRAFVGPDITWRTEVAVGQAGDPRAWAAVMRERERRAGVEAEVHVHDWQALDRRIALRRRDTGIDLVVLVPADTHHNRAVLRELGPELTMNFPATSRRALAALRSGTLPTASAIVLV